MNEHDVIRAMGRFPDQINPVKRMESALWKCSNCGEIKPGKPHNPAPCDACGSICFETHKETT